MSTRAVIVAAVITRFVLGIVAARDGDTVPPPDRSGTVTAPSGPTRG